MPTTSTTTSVPLSPSEIGNLLYWFDSSDYTTLYSNPNCNVNAFPNEYVYCWNNKSQYGNLLNLSYTKPNGIYSYVPPTLIYDSDRDKTLLYLNGTQTLPSQMSLKTLH